MTPKQITLDRQAVLARVNRRLRARGEKLLRARGHAAEELGDWYCIRLRDRDLVGSKLELEKVARQLDVLRDWEAVGA